MPAARRSPEAELLDALLDGLEPLARQMVDESRREIPAFSVVPYDEQLAETLVSIEFLARYALEDPTPEPDLDRLALLGARRAAQGIRVEDLLRAWRLSVQIGTDRAAEIAEERQLDAQLVIDVFQGALRAADEALVPLAAGHRDAVAAPPPDPGQARERFVIAALTGELEPEAMRGQAAGLGLDLTRSYRAVRAAGADAGEGTPPPPWSESGDGPAGLITVHDGELIGFTAADIERGAADLVAVGPSGQIEELPRSFAAAGRILTAAQSLGLAGVHDISSAALFVAVFESGDAGDALVARYVDPVGKAANAADLLATVRTWQEAGMRADTAAERLHIHPNTLRYRLGRIEKLLDRSLRNPATIAELHLALLTRTY